MAVFEKAGRYMDKVAERLQRAKGALEAASIPYAVIGGNAVMAWIATADESAIRPTQDVDMLVDEERFDDVKKAMAGAGFVYRKLVGINMFLDGPKGKPREAIHVVFGGRKVMPDYAVEAPRPSESVQSKLEFRVLTLEALVRMKLTSYRLKDQVHLQDLVSVGLVTETWPEKYSPPLRERLQKIIENPEA